MSGSARQLNTTSASTISVLISVSAKDAGKFYCDNEETIISKERQCDTLQDCDDGTDEMDCDVYGSKFSGSFSRLIKAAKLVIPSPNYTNPLPTRVFPGSTSM